ncbi:hypothetical protein V8C86DRAFT_1800522, partial [Haematococcus lacustris]
VVCLDEPASVGLLHGSTVHQCVCVACAELLAEQPCGSAGPACPVCRLPVERLLSVF